MAKISTFQGKLRYFEINLKKSVLSHIPENINISKKKKFFKSILNNINISRKTTFFEITLKESLFAHNSLNVNIEKCFFVRISVNIYISRKKKFSPIISTFCFKKFSFAHLSRNMNISSRITLF